MYFMSTVCGRPQGGLAMWTGGGGVKNVNFVDVINGWPLIDSASVSVWLSKLVSCIQF